MPDQPRSAAGQTLEAFFQRRDIPLRPCPVCAGEDWGIYQAGGSDLCLIRLAADGVLRNPPQAVRLYVMVCQGCGFIRQHARRYVDGAGDE